MKPFNNNNLNDSCIAGTHCEGWINVSEDTKNMLINECIFESKEAAINNENRYNASHKKHITTIKIEWEE